MRSRSASQMTTMLHTLPCFICDSFKIPSELDVTFYFSMIFRKAIVMLKKLHIFTYVVMYPPLHVTQRFLNPRTIWYKAKKWSRSS